MIKPLLLLAILFLAGCSQLDNCPDEAKRSIYAAEGTTNLETLTYTSAPWGGPRNEFPAKTCVRFEHGLGTTPEIVNTYVSFSSKGGDETENAGNQGRIKCVDGEQIVIKNDTCEESFFIRVVAQASGATTTPNTCADLDDSVCPTAD